MEKLNSFDRECLTVDKGINAVPKEFFREELKIPEEKIMSFVNICAEDPEFKFLVSNEDHLRLLEYYFENGTKFLKQPRE